MGLRVRQELTHARRKIVIADHLDALGEQAIDQSAANESRRSGDECHAVRVE